MPHLSLKVLRNPRYRCDDSSPRYKRGNYYAILAHLKISYVFNYKISITPPFGYVSERVASIRLQK